SDLLQSRRFQRADYEYFAAARTSFSPLHLFGLQACSSLRSASAPIPGFYPRRSSFLQTLPGPVLLSISLHDGTPFFLTGYVQFHFYSLFQRMPMLHSSSARTRITASGMTFSIHPPASVIRQYPHTAGNAFPMTCSTFGSSSFGNKMPDKRIDGRKTSIDHMEVLL